MEKTTEQPTRRPVRAGYWQYPDMTLMDRSEGRAGRHGARAAQGAQAEARANAQMGKALAWLSIGVGVLHLLAPRAVARAAGLPNWPMLLRAIGVRELACGIGLLARPSSNTWRWTRVAGDAMDLTLLGVAAFAPGSDPRRLAATAAAVAGVTALDVGAGTRTQRRRSTASAPLAGLPGPQRVQKSITINRPADECYRFWRNVESFPSFMDNIESVKALDERRSHWVAKGPAGRKVEWDAEITDDQPGRLLAWRSLKGTFDNAGRVRFADAPGGRGTVLQVQMDYTPPAGRAGALVAKLFGADPAHQVEADLRRFKQLMETGEIATTRGQAHGPRTLKARLFNRGAEQ